MMTYFVENESLLATTFLFKGTLAQMTTLHNKPSLERGNFIDLKSLYKI